MSELLDYLDSVSIDVVKRKYYNANKVNAVFEELRARAAALEEENVRLRAELEEAGREERLSQEALASLQSAYREALHSAHLRADGMLASAEEKSGALLKRAERRSELAARQVEECLNAVRVRQEQNVEFLNESLRRFLTELYEEDDAQGGRPQSDSPGRANAQAQANPWQAAGAPSGAGIEAELRDEGADPEASLRRRLSALSSEISALEEGK